MTTLRRTVASFELAIAVLAAYVAGAATLELVNPPSPPRGEWTPLIPPVFAPLSLAFGWAGLALLREWPRSWAHQFAPGLVIAAAAAFFYWADRGSL